MKTILSLATLFLISMPAFCENIVGIGTLVYLKEASYQPDSCESDSRKNEKCITLSTYRVFSVDNFYDLENSTHKKIRVVFPSHSQRRFSLFMVLQKLSNEDSAKFGAEYKIMKYEMIFNSVCLDEKIQSYVQKSELSPYGMDNNGKYCYGADSLRYEFDER